MTHVILCGLTDVYSTCTTCGELLQVTDQSQRTHPMCEQTELESFAAQLLQAALDYDNTEAERIESAMAERDKLPTLSRAARYYTTQGWPVFPLAPGTKIPAISKDKGGKGCLDATADTGRVTRRWRRHPRDNIGLATGQCFDVIDIDPTAGGAYSLARLLESGQIPDVHGIACTPRAGMHLYVKPRARGNAAGLHDGIDYRGKGGYVVAPPSKIGKDKHYWWIVPPSPVIKEKAIAHAGR